MDSLSIFLAKVIYSIEFRKLRNACRETQTAKQLMYAPINVIRTKTLFLVNIGNVTLKSSKACENFCPTIYGAITPQINQVWVG
jgi:hypothetical protein